MPRHRAHAHRDTPRPASQRQLRVGEELRHALAQLLRPGELRDPALRDTSVTVTEVRISPDLRNATAFVMPLAGEHADEVMAGLKRSAPFLKARIARMVELRHGPQYHLRVRPGLRQRGADHRVAGASRRSSATCTPTRTMRKPTNNTLHGWLIVDKPLGLTSARVVAMVTARYRRQDRTCRHARPAGHRRVAAGDRRGDQDCAIRDGRPQTLSLSYPLGHRDRD